MRYESEQHVCKDALFIVDPGACNARAVLAAMVEMMDWLRAAPAGAWEHGGEPATHPAIRLCMSQLGVLTGTSPCGDIEGFTEVYDYCKRMVPDA